MKRLEAVYSLITPCKLFADIGTDHGFIAGYAAERCQRVIAADISESCLDKARQSITAANVEFRVGDGLTVLNGYPNQKETKSDSPDIIAICGMGGHTIIGILSGYKGNARLILQPQSEAALLRKFLLLNGFSILKDFVALERKKYYDVLLAEKTAQSLQALPDFGLITTDGQIDEGILLFGRFYKQKSELLKQRLLYQRQKLIGFKQTDSNQKLLNQIDGALKWQE